MRYYPPIRPRRLFYNSITYNDDYYNKILGRDAYEEHNRRSNGNRRRDFQHSSDFGWVGKRHAEEASYDYDYDSDDEEYDDEPFYYDSEQRRPTKSKGGNEYHESAVYQYSDLYYDDDPGGDYSEYHVAGEELAVEEEDVDDDDHRLTLTYDEYEDFVKYDEEYSDDDEDYEYIPYRQEAPPQRKPIRKSKKKRKRKKTKKKIKKRKHTSKVVQYEPPEYDYEDSGYLEPHTDTKITHYPHDMTINYVPEDHHEEVEFEEYDIESPYEEVVYDDHGYGHGDHGYGHGDHGYKGHDDGYGYKGHDHGYKGHDHGGYGYKGHDHGYKQVSTKKCDNCHDDSHDIVPIFLLALLAGTFFFSNLVISLLSGARKKRKRRSNPDWEHQTEGIAVKVLEGISHFEAEYTTKGKRDEE